MVFKYVKFFIVITFLSCTSKDTSPQYIDGDDLIPPEPSLMSYFTVYGKDVDQDGVRDDLELYINKKFNDSNMRKAYKSDAKFFDSFMKATDVEEINNLFKSGIDTSICISVFNYTVKKKDRSLVLQWKEMLLNNSWRKDNYNEKAKFVKKGIYSWGDMSIMSSLKRCKIQFTDLHISLRSYLNSNYKYGMTTVEIKEFEKIMKITK